MPMPKSKLLKKSHLKTVTASPVTNEVHENPDFDEEKFEVELCWCIHQLQTALKSGKLSEKQVQDHRKALNSLMSHSTPLIRKRQVMRLSFGDYRAKMAEEDKKLRRVNIKMKLQEAKPSSRSIFFKKHIFTKESDEMFRFHFKKPDSVNNINENLANLSFNQTKDFKFRHSDNSFTFNFNAVHGRTLACKK